MINKDTIKTWLIISACLFVAGFFIFNNLGKAAFWLDEACVATAIQGPFGELYKILIAEFHPISYIYAIKIWATVFGDSESALRGFSAFWALAIIVLIYKVGAYLWNDRRKGLLAAGLISLNYFLLWFGTQARPYTFIAFLSLASFYSFIYLLRQPSRWKYFSYIVITLIGVYAHPWFVLFFGSQFLCLIYFYFKDRKKFRNVRILAAQLVVGILFLPNAMIFLQQKDLGSNSWIPRVGFSTFFESFHYLTFGSTWVYLAAIVTAIFYFMLSTERDKQNDNSGKEFNVVVWAYLLFPIFSAFLISQFSPIYVVGRYEMIVLPALILIMANLLSKIKERELLIIIFTLLFVFTAKSASDRWNAVASFKSDNRTMAEEILKNLKNGDIVVSTDLNVATFNYYFGHSDIKDKKFEFLSFPAEIKNHPGWRKVDLTEGEKNDYKKEAEKIVGDLSKIKTGNFVWVIYESSSVYSNLLFDEMNAKFKKIREIEPPEPRDNLWFDKIIVFSL